jgi:hypothetical protein
MGYRGVELGESVEDEVEDGLAVANGDNGLIGKEFESRACGASAMEWGKGSGGTTGSGRQGGRKNAARGFGGNGGVAVS